MRFVTEVGQATTGNNYDSRTRSEFREMLRGSNRSIEDDGSSGDFRNNWALGYINLEMPMLILHGELVVDVWKRRCVQTK